MAKLIKNQYRQGDILFIKDEKWNGKIAEPEAKQIQRDAEGRLVVAHGEGGHIHHIAAKEARLFEGDRPGLASLYIEGDQISILHEEHGPHPLSPGKWNVIRQREMDEEMERLVED